METRQRNERRQYWQLFKSYYVVWKLIKRVIAKKKAICLNRTMQYGNFYFLENLIEEMFVFKSYYVVWKLLSEVKTACDELCLNRTMQYGNVGVAEFNEYYEEV